MLGGCRMHARVAAGHAPPDRPPVVLVHGLVASSRYMVRLATRIAPDFPVFAPDFPGFGRSDAPARTLDVGGMADVLADWAEARGLRRAVFVGNSLGCNVLAEFGARHAPRVDRLVLQGPTGDPGARAVPRLLVRWAANAWREPSMGGILFKDYAAAGIPRAVRTFRFMTRHRIEDWLPRVEAPTVVLRGTRDPLVSHDWAVRLADLLPRGRLVEIEGGHTLNHFAAEAVAAVVRDFATGEAT